MEHVDEHLRAAAVGGGVPAPSRMVSGYEPYMLAAVIIFATVVAVIGLIALLVNLD